VCLERDKVGFFNIIPNVTCKSSWNGFLFLCFISVRELYFFFALFAKLLKRGRAANGGEYLLPSIDA
jgi:hypothetical protein